LQPRGGGTFIAEFDGNLTCRCTETATEVHWQGKFRGPDFAPMHFILDGVTTARLKDSRGNQVWTVNARPPALGSSTRDGNDFTSRFPLAVAAVLTRPERSFLIGGEARHG
jgi:hypothetical protein